MSDLTIAFGVLGTIFWFLFILFGILSFEVKLSFDKYKSALTAIQRYGVILSLEQANEIYFNGELRNEDVLEIFGSAGHDKVDMNGDPIDEAVSPWHLKKVGPTGEIQEYADTEHLFSGTSPIA